jgi:hypothetical protein
MIGEETLANLLTAYAERIPVPPSAVADLLAASPRPESAATSRFARPSARVLAAAAAVLVAVGAVWAVGVRSGGGAPATERAASVPTTGAGAAFASPPTGSAALRSRAGQAALAGTDKITTGAPSFSPYGVTPQNGRTVTSDSAKALARAAAADSARVVRTGTLDLRITRHGFGTTIGRITTITAAAGGFLADAKTFESAAIPSGTVTIRVPSARFNATVERLRALGTVVGATTRGVDVTGQYTDLQARLRAATATRDQFLTVLSGATNIGDILAVQDRIQAVQTQIEQLQGQIGQLNDQTTYGTITISIAEPGPKPKAIVGPPHHSGLSIAWGNARNGFARRVEGLISHSGSALVVVLGLLLVAFALRLLVPRVRRLLV